MCHTESFCLATVELRGGLCRTYHELSKWVDHRGRLRFAYYTRRASVETTSLEILIAAAATTESKLRTIAVMQDV